METSPRSNPGLVGQGSEFIAAMGRRPYRTPRLTLFGDIRGITLGGSPGISDSGMNNMEDMVFFTNDFNGLP